MWEDARLEKVGKIYHPVFVQGYKVEIQKLQLFFCIEKAGIQL